MFILHKIGNPIGRETWRITREPDGARRLSTDFTFTDRGTAVTLTATLDYAANARPTHFTLGGQTSRMSTVSLDVTMLRRLGADPRGQHHRHGTREGRLPRPRLRAHRHPAGGHARMAAPRPARRRSTWCPRPRLHITARGTDTITVADRSVILQRYSVAGLIWGRETLWLDARGDLIAAVTIDAEFDPVQAVREGFESATGTFVKLAAGDAIAALSGSGAARTTDTLIALVGGTLIDGTGAPPVPDAAIVIRGTKIVAAGPRAEVRIPRGARVINTTGTTMLPGLWEMHAHYAQVEWGPIYLASGITTARDVGNQLEFLLGAREVLNSGHGIGPRLLAAGIIDGDVPTGIGLARAATPEQGAAWVRRYHDAGLRADQGLQQPLPRGAPGHHRRGACPWHDGDRSRAPRHGRVSGRRSGNGPDQPHFASSTG